MGRKPALTVEVCGKVKHFTFKSFKQESGRKSQIHCNMAFELGVFLKGKSKRLESTLV